MRGGGVAKDAPTVPFPANIRQFRFNDVEKKYGIIIRLIQADMKNLRSDSHSFHQSPPPETEKLPLLALVVGFHIKRKHPVHRIDRLGDFLDVVPTGLEPVTL